MSEYGSVTRCPWCSSAFHVGLLQLEAAGGRVRCGGCLQVFNARDHFVVEQKSIFDITDAQSDPSIQEPKRHSAVAATNPTAGYATPPVIEPEEIDIADEAAEPDYGSGEPDEFDEPEETEELEDLEDLEDLEELGDIEELDEEDEDDPIFTAQDSLQSALDAAPQTDTSVARDHWQPLIPQRDIEQNEDAFFSSSQNKTSEHQDAEDLFVSQSSSRSASTPPQKIWRVLAVLMIGAAFYQLFFWQAPMLREQRWYSDISASVCPWLHCREFMTRDLDLIEVSGIVLPSRQFDTALLVQAELRNRAATRQFYPTIELSFTDLQGRTIAFRRFISAEYLRSESSGRTWLEPGQRVQIEMEIYDPGAAAISYEFNLAYVN